MEAKTIEISPNVKIGDGNFCIIGGPCAIESQKQAFGIAKDIYKKIDIYRGGAYKPRTSPYSFQGLGKDGIDLLVGIKKKFNLPIITEIINPAHLDYYEHVDVIQVGSRNMQNFELLKELGTIRKPILLKRGFSNTLEELLLSAEYIVSGGNQNIILCERGIRTFEPATRNTLDLSAVPMLKIMAPFPIVVDPSHGTGDARLVEAMAKAATAAGADGIMIEVHNNPEKALCDKNQALTPVEFNDLIEKVNIIKKIL